MRYDYKVLEQDLIKCYVRCPTDVSMCYVTSLLQEVINYLIKCIKNVCNCIYIYYAIERLRLIQILTI